MTKERLKSLDSKPDELFALYFPYFTNHVFYVVVIVSDSWAQLRTLSLQCHQDYSTSLSSIVKYRKFPTPGKRAILVYALYIK